jgi:hypothetical protein
MSSIEEYKSDNYDEIMKNITLKEKQYLMYCKNEIEKRQKIQIKKK